MEYPNIQRGLDEQGNITDITTYKDGRLHFENLSQTELLQMILVELRTMNIHLMTLSGEQIGDEDIDNT